MKRVLMAVLALMLFWPQQGVAQSATPALNANDWNFVLVPSFEVPPASQKTNNLSVVGLNHSLRFGQMLKGLTTGKDGQLQALYALTSTADTNDMAPLQSIQPYALLTDRAINVTSVQTGDPSAYNSSAALVATIMGNQPRGTYILAAPAAVIGELALALGGSGAPLPGGTDYLVLAGDRLPLSLGAYDDGISPNPNYPAIPLPPLSKSCPSAAVTVKAPAPPGLKPYTSQTVHLIRHVEAHPTDSFENGNYVCQGQWRALGANDLLMRIMKRRPDYIFTSNPAGLINCGSACSYIRPTLTVSPFAIQSELPLTLAPFQWNDPEDLARALFDRASPYFQHSASGATILVGWEHGNIEKAVKILFASVYKNPQAAAQLPAWSYTDYDTVWTLSTDKDGNLTFTNSCEHIPTASLPSTCPAFWQ